MGSKKVPGMVAMYYNGNTWHRLPSHLQSRTLVGESSREHTYTHRRLLHRSCHCWKRRRKVCFRVFRSSAVAFDLMSYTVPKCVPLRHIFIVGKIKKLLRMRSGDYDGWVTRMFVSARNCCTSDGCVARCAIVMQKPLFLPLGSVRFLWTAERNLCKTCK
jgi:hypothetical protein